MNIEADKEVTLTPIPHYNVIICTPGSSMVNSYTSSLLNTIDVLNKNGISWKYQNEYTSIVATAREGTIADTMNFQVNTNKPGLGKYTYDKIFMIDSDISWDPDDFLNLYNSEEDIVSGCYSVVQYELIAAFRSIYDGQPINYNEIKNEKGLIEVGSIGLGFCCVKSGVFESISRPWFFYPVIPYTAEDGSAMQSPNFSEDTAICYKWVNEGNHKIMLNPQVTVAHNKTFSFNLNYLKNKNSKDEV
jgi:hypothetical protein